MYAEQLQTKTCTKCKSTKELEEFQPDPRYALGVKSQCRKCLNEYVKQKGFAKKYAERNKEKLKAYSENWKSENKERYDKARRQWVRDNKKKVLAETRKYQASKMQRTPSWLSKEQKKKMTEFYERCEKEFEVDHIIPLQGKDVSGLHVPWNLQYLKKSDNRRKSNKQ